MVREESLVEEGEGEAIGLWERLDSVMLWLGVGVIVEEETEDERVGFDDDEEDEDVDRVLDETVHVARPITVTVVGDAFNLTAFFPESQLHSESPKQQY